MYVTTVRRRRLAAELRRYRDDAGLTLEQAAEQSGLSAATLSRAENALVPVKMGTVLALTAAYGVPADVTAALVQLARDAKQKGWWQAYGDLLSSHYADLIELEATATTITEYATQWVPGLLQTEPYARALIAATLANPLPAEVERRTKLRVERQAQLAGTGLHVIIDECVLRRPVGGVMVMREQMRRLIEANGSGITVQVLPLDSGAHPGLSGPFLVLTFPKAPSVVYLEGVFGEVFEEDEERVCRIARVFDELTGLALSPGKSADMIKTIME